MVCTVEIRGTKGPKNKLNKSLSSLLYRDNLYFYALIKYLYSLQTVNVTK